MSNNLAITRTQARWLLLILFPTTVLLLVGLFSPMLTLSSFYFFSNSFSVTGGIYNLFNQGQWLLGILVSLFSIFLPLLKIIFLFLVIRSQQDLNNRQSYYLKLMHDYGRWAMLDVLVVAVLIVTVKLGMIASIEIHWGFYVFASAVLLIMLLTHRVARLIEP